LYVPAVVVGRSVAGETYFVVAGLVASVVVASVVEEVVVSVA
jgi:hypothetical protein